MALASAGASVVIAGRTSATLDEACREARERGVEAEPVVCDVRELADTQRLIDATIARFGRLDILINNAQTYRHALLVDATEEDMEATWRSGPLAVFRLMRMAQPHLASSSQGVIINFGSGAQLMTASRGVVGNQRRDSWWRQVMAMVPMSGAGSLSRVG